MRSVPINYSDNTPTRGALGKQGKEQILAVYDKTLIPKLKFSNQ